MSDFNYIVTASGKSSSLLDLLDDEERQPLAKWIDAQPRAAGEAIDLLKWPGWLDVVVHNRASFKKSSLTGAQRVRYDALVEQLRGARDLPAQQAARIFAMLPGDGDLSDEHGAFGAAAREAVSDLPR